MLKIEIRYTRNERRLIHQRTTIRGSLIITITIAVIARESDPRTAFHVQNMFFELQRRGLHKFVPANYPNRLDFRPSRCLCRRKSYHPLDVKFFPSDAGVKNEFL